MNENTEIDPYEKACSEFLEEYEGVEIPTGKAANCCDMWTIGEPRCSCGNRRMYVDAMEFDGEWLAFPQAD